MNNTEVKRLPSQERPWMKYYPPDADENNVPKTTAYRYIWDINKDNLDGYALHYYGTNITYRQLDQRIDETAKALAGIGVKAGDIVSLLTVAVPECIATVYALNKLGATANCMDPRLDIASIARMTKESGSKVLITIDLAWPKVAKIMDEIKQDLIITQSAARSLPFVKKVAMTLANKTKVPYSDTVINWDTLLEKGKGVTYEEAPYVGDHTVAITYTGGTTGFPKGVMLTNDSMNAVAFSFRNAGIDYEIGDRFLGIIPVFTSYGMVCGLHMPLAMQCQLVPIPKFDPTKFGKLIKDFRPNHVINTPAFIEMLMNSKEMKNKNMDLSFLKTLASGGDTMNDALEEKLNKFIKDHNMPYPLAQGYGMSELSAAASFCVNDRYKPKSVGIPSLTVDMMIVDPETDEELGYNQIGDICVTGPTMMKGYFNRPEETENVMRLRDDGRKWIYSGDIGYMDEDGFVYIKGRVKRMICRFDGHKVFPVNIESMVVEHPQVRNCCVVGINDLGHGQGEYPLIVLETREGADRDAICKDVYNHCMEYLEERGKPVAVIAVDEIPLTGMGKNDYRTLESQYKDFDYVTWQNNL